MIVWRVMAQTESPGPKLGASMTTLGARVRDLHPRVDGTVDPREGGVSVSPEGLEHLPRSARIIIDNGRGVAFALETEDLPDHLVFRPDPYEESHGFVEPAYPMKFEVYQRAVQETSELWQPV